MQTCGGKSAVASSSGMAWRHCQVPWHSDLLTTQLLFLVPSTVYRKGAQFIGQEVSRGINEAQKGNHAHPNRSICNQAAQQLACIH